MENINKSIGVAIYELRNSYKMSQEKLAELSGLHRTYISDVERGNRNITIVSLSKIANALHVSLSQLLREAEFYDAKFKN